jgi:hypothetical protein
MSRHRDQALVARQRELEEQLSLERRARVRAEEQAEKQVGGGCLACLLGR